MIFEKTPIKGAWLVDLKKIGDERGFFSRAWCSQEFENHGISSDLSQANLSFSKQAGTLRGMHFQKSPHSEMKAVRCIRGSLWDVIIDLRPKSETFLQSFGAELSEENRKMLVLPEGCAHGFQTLEDDTEAFYLVSAAYAPSFEAGIRWNDPAFNIAWPIAPTEISQKDSQHPDYNVAQDNGF